MCETDRACKKVLDNLYTAIYFVDREKRIIYWNRGAELLTGFRESEVRGRPCWEILPHYADHGAPLCKVSCLLEKALANRRPCDFDTFMYHKDGHRLAVSARIIQCSPEEGEAVAAIEIYRDRSPKYDLYQRLENLQKMSLSDPLTGLANRKKIESDLQHRIDEVQRYGGQIGILFFEINNFERIDHDYGGYVSDKLLKMVARTLPKGVRSFDTVGRWKSNEFMAILYNVNLDQLQMISERLRLLIEQSGLSVTKDGVQVTVSMGGTLFQPHDTVQGLLERVELLKSASQSLGCTRIAVNLPF